MIDIWILCFTTFIINKNTEVEYYLLLLKLHELVVYFFGRS